MSKYVPVYFENLRGKSFNDESLRDCADVLEITLVDEKHKTAAVRFNDFIAYRKLDEGDALRSVSEIANAKTPGHLLYLVENSSFLEWFREENEHVRDAHGLKHFCLATLNSVIDVIAFSDPEMF